MNNILEQVKNVLDKMNDIDYGFVYDGNNIYPEDNKNWDSNFSKKYYLQSPDEIIKNKCGVCWDQVELERYYLENKNIECSSYFIIAYDNKIYPTHTFIVVNDRNIYYWLEHSWEPYRGIHKFNNLDDLLYDVRTKFEKTITETDFEISIYKYNKPSYGLSCIDFMNYCEKGKKINLK